MSLTVQKYPPEFSLVKNRILFKIRSDNIYETPGVYSKLIMILSTAVEDEEITLTWGTNTVTLTAKDSPDGSGTQFRAKNVASLDIWLGQFVTDVRKNYYLTRDFNITIETDPGWMTARVYFTAKNYGPEYDIVVSDCTITGYTDSDVAGVAEVIRENYGIIMQIHRFDGTDYTLLAEDLLTSFDENLDFVNDIHEYLNDEDEIYSEFEYPEVTGVIQRDAMTSQFVIRYTDKYGDTVNGFLSSSLYNVLNGGIAKWAEKDFWVESTSFWERLQTNKSFLSTWPQTKKTRIDLPEKLYFLNWKTHALLSNNIELIAKIYYTDGTTTNTTCSIFAGVFYKVFELQVGYDMLGLAAIQPSKTVSKYEIWLQLETTSEVISEVKTYEIDWNYYKDVNFFVYKNSLGGFNFFYTSGVFAYNIIYDGELVRQLEPAELTADYREFIETNKSYDFIIKVNTGWIPNRETYNSLIDFLLSDEKYHVRYTGKLSPILIQNSKISDVRSDSYLDNFDFEFKYNEYKTIYSQDPAAYVAGDFNDDFADDFLT